MDRNKVFEAVALHLLSQNRKSTESWDTGVCTYRGHDGMKCALGALIPDNIYHSDIEGTALIQFDEAGCDDLFAGLRCNYDYVPGSTEHLVYMLHQAVGIDRATDIAFLGDLQRVHDKHPTAFWPEELNEVADLWDIVISNPTLLEKLPA